MDTENNKTLIYPDFSEEKSDCVSDSQIPLIFKDIIHKEGTRRVLSLFSGCGGMDLGFEGSFIASARSFPPGSRYVSRQLNKDWVLLKKTRFDTVFANDILPEARIGWTTYMRRFGHDAGMYHLGSIVDFVKMWHRGVDVFPEHIDVVTGGFPCQDFSVAGKRMGFNSQKDDLGKSRQAGKPSEESRGKLYFWMKQVIDIVRPKIFVAENVKGLVNLGNVKEIIQQDFASANGGGYIVLTPRVLHAGNYGVPESRERVIFIGVRKDALRPEALEALGQEDIPSLYDPYPRPTHACTIQGDGLLPIVTTHDVLKDLKEPDLTSDESQAVYSRAKYLGNGSQEQVEIKLDNIGPTIRSEHHGNIEFRRLSATHGGKHAAELRQGLPERRLTPRECAMIQTFPPDYRFVMRHQGKRGYLLSPSGAYKIIGNAVPPVLAYHIAIRLEEVWDLYFKR